MLHSLRESTIRPNPGTRPMALLILAFGVAIGGSLAGGRVRAIDPPGFAPVTVQPGAVAAVAAVAPKPVRVIPLPLRNAPANAAR